MLTKSLAILNHFVADSSLLHGFDYFEYIKLDVEESLYLCSVNTEWFLVVETDFVMNLQNTYDDAKQLLDNDFMFNGWVMVDEPAKIMANVDGADKMVVYKDSESHMRYAVIKLQPKHTMQQTSTVAYGGVKK